MNGRATTHFFLFLCCAVTGGAQSGSSPSTALMLTGTDARSAVVPAGSTSTLLTFTVEEDTTGNNFFDVATSDPAVVVSILLPSSAEVTAANAPALGFTFTTAVAGTNDRVEIPSVLTLPGTHTIIQIPGGQVSGTYQIKANAGATTSDSGMLATYFSSSSAEVTAATDADNYKIGDTVILSGLVFDGTSPITGASVTAAISPRVSLAGQTSLGNYQLVSQRVVSPNLTDYTYSGTLTNNGPSAQGVMAQLASLPPGVTILNGTLAFGDVAASASVVSINALTIETNPSQAFDPSTLQWNVTSAGPVTNVTLTDSGPFDTATGDGIYTGTFTPTVAGVYGVVVSITGTSLAGNRFSRTSVTQFTVTQQALASLGSFSDALSLAGGVTVTATVDVQTTGSYFFASQLQASNQNIISGSTIAALSTGSQQISVTFSAEQMLQLAVDGPYERVNALLLFQGNDPDLVADSKADAGPTAAYKLSDLSSAYFTGRNAISGIDLTGSGTFDVLRVQAGVVVPVGVCTWTGVLYTQQGSLIDTSYGSGALGTGSNSIGFDFNGSKIAQAGDGPYGVGATVICGSASASMSPRIQTQAFTAAQVHNVPPGFVLSLPVSSRMMASGPTSSDVLVAVKAIGAFNGNVTFSIGGLSSGLTSSVFPPVVFGSGMTAITLSADGSAIPGVYPLNITGTSGSISQTVPLTLTITAFPAFVFVSPRSANMSPGQSKTLSATVYNAPSNAVTWSVFPLVGTVSSAGVYSAPASVAAQQTVQLIAASVVDPTILGSATINLSPSTGIMVSPASGTLYASEAQQFTATVANASNGSVTVWSHLVPFFRLSCPSD
jgi:hypothetical protein